MMTPHTNGSTSNTTTGITTEDDLTPYYIACPKLLMTPEALDDLCRYRHIDSAPGKVDLEAVQRVPEHIIEHFRQEGMAKWAAIVQAQLKAYGVRLRKAQALQLTTYYCYDSWQDEDAVFEMMVRGPEDVVNRFIRRNGIVMIF